MDFTLGTIQKSHCILLHCIVSWHCKKQTQTNKQSKIKQKACENLNSCCPWVTLGERRIDRKLISLFLWNTLMRKPSLSALKIPTLTASKYHSLLFHVYIHHPAFTNLLIFLLHKYVKILLCFFSSWWHSPLWLHKDTESSFVSWSFPSPAENVSPKFWFPFKYQSNGPDRS